VKTARLSAFRAAKGSGHPYAISRALRGACESQAKKLCLGAMQREVTMFSPHAWRNRIWWV
jgi:hypothetical protein